MFNFNATASEDRRRFHLLWVERLHYEFEQICFQFSVKLAKPLIAVDVASTNHGSWGPYLRTLKVSEKLILTHPWTTVVEILKHEMAHQIVTDLFGLEEMHGGAFQRACDMLGVSEWARRATGELPREIPDWRDAALSEEEQKLLRRVEKLLSLAQSANEHEAFLAMQRVQELYARYNIDQLRGKARAAYVVHVVNFKKSRVSQVETRILSLLSEHYFVRVIFAGTFDPILGSAQKTAEIFGRRENVLMADYVYEFLKRELDSLWARFKTVRRASGLRARQSYMIGVLAGFSEKLKSHEEAVRQTAVDLTNADRSSSAALSLKDAKALLAKHEEELEDFVAQRYPRLQRRSRRSGRADMGAYEAGQEDGRKLVLHKGVHARQGGSGLALGPKGG